jgi:hypothetical protein
MDPPWRPNPHPLDFDWRFSARTRSLLERRFGAAERPLFLGAPSLFLPPSRLYMRGTLVDRQPVMAPLKSKFVGIDLRYVALRDAVAINGFDSAFLDAPWYPADLRVWLEQVLNVVIPGGKIEFTLWPDNTRPTARHERQEILSWLREFGEVSVIPELIEYDTPLFEKNASRARGEYVAGKRRHGDLVELRLRERFARPEIKLFPRGSRIWHRFILDATQFAICSGGVDDCGEISVTPVASTWLFDSVSRRDRRRDEINLWTSDGVAAHVGGASKFTGFFKGIVQGTGGIRDAAVESALRHIGIILMNRYGRRLEWSHFE